MCGIIGQVEFQGQVDPVHFDKMRDTLAHRGPDGVGSWVSDDGRVALGHRRLAFLDLSEAGAQPMCSEDGQLIVTLNGEIYNYLELRDELSVLGNRFRTDTDTEVLLHGYRQWGMEGVVSRIVGMFAFGLFDRRNGKLFLVRDRFGIKPLYYHLSAQRLIFASELKAIMVPGLVPRELDRTSFLDYFVYRYIPSPNTIWEHVSKLPPSHLLELDVRDGMSAIKEYWTPMITDHRAEPEALAAQVGDMLSNSVAIHSRSDVEIGAFLSGGYDSSAIASLLKGSVHSLRTFSIGFEGWENSEDRYAEKVARHIGAGHIPLMANSDSLDLLDLMPMVYDEPIADISIIPTWLVSRSAAGHVKAVMSGEGADELFGGYNWQKEYFAKWHPIGVADRVKAFFTDRSATAVADYAEFMAMGRFDRQELQRMASPRMSAHIRTDPDWFYRQHHRPELSPLKSIQYMDMKCFMAELVLTKVDRASMAHSLEVRVPFLDHRLFDLVLACDERDYFRPDVTKFLLYQNIKDKLPSGILNRPKQGFVGPDSYYMDMARYQMLLKDSTMVKMDLVNEGYVLTCLEQHDHWRLWKLAVMELWCKHWLT
jgi:asparagine synthase (glutamine-hydrolysing)